ncbi:hypothetical protein ACFFJY_02965 [Fictibacillus aquaticus]|uniref:Uncharacterized protein n=1 Tax=Fictibacillus aquaticus TaxID=2021314 RepID=A0A235F913_9BACL|nr:hypothetical protein [Fictibacillus aquaticus]OYD57659.1 hypothetical protein CGZ90_13420 [Fictibacillus aquaticus]
MEKKIQRDVMNDFYQGKLTGVHETETEIVLSIDMSEFKQYYYSSIFYCELVNCSLLQLAFKNERLDLKDLHKYVVELGDTDIDDDRLVISCTLNDKIRATLTIETETIKIYDESKKEIDLLDLAIFGGLCSSDAGIDFTIGKTKKDVETSDESVKFNEGIAGYLAKQEQYAKRYREKGPREAFDLLLDLDPYGEKIFSKSEIIELISICEGIVAKYNTDHLNHRKLSYFAGRLKELCLKSLEDNLMLVAVGD